MDGHAGHLDPGGQRVADAVGAGKGRQQRRVEVDHPAGERRQHGRARRDACSPPGRPAPASPAARVSARMRSSSARAAASPRGAAGTSSVSIPCSTAQSRAAHARSAKTRAISASSAPRAAAACRARRLLPVPETPTAIRWATPLLLRNDPSEPSRLRIPRPSGVDCHHLADLPALEAVLLQARHGRPRPRRPGRRRPCRARR